MSYSASFYYRGLLKLACELFIVSILCILAIKLSVDFVQNFPANSLLANFKKEFAFGILSLTGGGVILYALIRVKKWFNLFKTEMKKPAVKSKTSQKTKPKSNLTTGDLLIDFADKNGNKQSLTINFDSGLISHQQDDREYQLFFKKITEIEKFDKNGLKISFDSPILPGDMLITLPVLENAQKTAELIEQQAKAKGRYSANHPKPPSKQMSDNIPAEHLRYAGF